MVSGADVIVVVSEVRLPALSTAVERTVAVAPTVKGPAYGAPITGSLPSIV